MEKPAEPPQGARQLQWGHGREAMDGWINTMAARAVTDFNGAMAVRPWMAGRRRECGA